MCLVVLSLVVVHRAEGDPVIGELFSDVQPDGTPFQVRVWGDEFYRVVESLDGYSVVRDPGTGFTCYARLSPEGNELLSTGVPVAPVAPPALPLPPHVRISPASVRAKVEAARARLLAEQSEVLARRPANPPPGPPNIGNVKGIVLLVDFSDQPGTIPPAEVDNYCNLIGYGGYGNNGSIRDYFSDVSDGNLIYTNYVTPAYYRAPQPKSWYDNPSVPCCGRALSLVTSALNNLESQGFDFSQYDSNGDDYVDAVNVFYAGTRAGPWNYGLWPHQGWVSFTADGVSTNRYQISDMQSTLKLGTFCHENGHMLGYWPDLYDYGYESTGAGDFCLMAYGGSDLNPVEPCAYLKDLAAWSTTTTLTLPQVGLSASAGINSLYRYLHPTRSNECYLIENRQQTGRDSSLPDAGLTIWHVDTGGSNDREEMLPAYHYMVTLVQADGNWDLENDVNYGDSSDLWAAPTYTQCGPGTDPNTRWWDGLPASLRVYDVSASGPAMTFSFFSDCNNNQTADTCDLSCAGPCAGQPGCGQSADCQADAIPDECQLTGTMVIAPPVEPSCGAGASNGDPWCDDFESYAPGTITGNGWEGWGGDPGLLGVVTSAQNHTPAGSQSLKIVTHDTVHVFAGYDPLVAAYWILRAWVFIPSTMSGQGYFIVNPDYVGGGAGTTWAVQLSMSAGAGTITSELGPGALPLVTDQWAEIRCEIDLHLGRVTIYYGNQYLATASWTSEGSSLNIAAIDLFSPDSSGFYYDDLALFPAESYTTDCNLNDLPDECDLAQGRSRDCNTNGVPDECAPTCLDDCECFDGSPCTKDQCIANACTHVGNIYGDIDGNGYITLADLFCVLDGFAGDFTNCSFEQDDIHGACGGGAACCPNGVISLGDLFAVLDAFGGEDPCCGG